MEGKPERAKSSALYRSMAVRGEGNETTLTRDMTCGSGLEQRASALDLEHTLLDV